jgi:VWFA-related protein
MMAMQTRPFLFFAAACLLAQDATIRVDVRQVLVPAVVTDRKGHHVSGLKAGDFQDFEDGVRQDIASFSSDKAASVDDLVALSAGQPPAASGPRHTFVICIDTLHVTASTAARMRQALASLFETEKPASAQYVLVGIGRQLRVLQPATTNPVAILVKVRSAAWQSAVNGMEGAPLAADLENTHKRMEDFCKHCGCGARTAQRSCESEVDTLKQNLDEEAKQWAAPLDELAGQFKSVVEELGALPTGRTLILASDGFNLNARREFYAVAAAYLPEQPQFKLDNAVQPAAFSDALRLAAGRNIAICTLDTRAAAVASNAGGSMDAATSGGAGAGSADILGTLRQSSRSNPVNPTAGASTERAIPRLEDSATLRQAAESTGGEYFRDGGDFVKQLRSALADGREYYVLAYVPKNGARDGKYRAITVETTDKKLTVRAKTGYWAEGAAQ